MFCTNCGNKLDESAVFCGKCGTPVKNVKIAPAADTGTVSTVSEKRGKTQYIKLGIVISCLLMSFATALPYLVVKKEFATKDFKSLSLLRAEKPFVTGIIFIVLAILTVVTLYKKKNKVVLVFSICAVLMSWYESSQFKKLDEMIKKMLGSNFDLKDFMSKGFGFYLLTFSVTALLVLSILNLLQSRRDAALLTMLLLAFSLSACGSSSGDLVQKLSENVKTEETEENESKENDKAEEPEESESNEKVESESVNEVVEGVHLNLDGDTLNIFGTGIVSKEDIGDARPVNVVVEEGITGIGTETFRGNDKIESITLPESLKDIGVCAFMGCESLASVTLPNSLQNIEDYAFQDCNSLISIVLPDGLQRIGEGVFLCCSNLEEVTIGDNVSSVGGGIFTGCDSLLKINASESTRKHFSGKAGSDLDESVPIRANLDGDTLYISGGGTVERNDIGDTQPVNVVVEEGITKLGNDVFKGCKSLESITLPDSLKYIGVKAFSGCTNLTSITLPDGLSDINQEAFRNSGLESITLPGTLIGVCTGVFYECENLTSVTLLSGINFIGDYAFFQCENLISVTLGDGLESIGEDAFYGCKNLESITLPDSLDIISSLAFYGCESLTSVTIPDRVRLISGGGGAFISCRNLKEVTLGTGLEELAFNTFNECDSLEKIKAPESIRDVIEKSGIDISLDMSLFEWY